MSGIPSTRTQAAGLAVMAGLGVLGWVAGGDSGADPDRATMAEPERAIVGPGALTEEGASVRSTSTNTPASRKHQRGQPSVSPAARDERTASAGDDDDPGGSDGSDANSSGEGSHQSTPPEAVEIVVPHRVIITMPQYRPGTPPTANPPAASVRPPTVTHDANTIIIELPQAEVTPPSIEPGRPGQFTPPSVTVE